MFTPNRVVAVLTPLVFAPLAGAICAWAAEALPGVNLSQQRVTEIFVAGALFALPPALQWLHGWQKYEQREAEAQQAVEVANAAGIAAALPPAVAIEESGAVHDELVDDAAALDLLEQEGAEDDLAGSFDEDADPLIDEDDEPARVGV